MDGSTDRRAGLGKEEVPLHQIKERSSAILAGTNRDARAISGGEAEQLFRRHALSFLGSILDDLRRGSIDQRSRGPRALTLCRLVLPRLALPRNIEQYFFGRERRTEVLTLSDSF